MCGLVVAVALLFVGGAWAATERVLYSFTGGSDGGSPLSPLIFDSSGNLYSTTGGGGAYGYGTVFELSPASGGGWTETVLYSFGAYPGDGMGPSEGAPLVLDENGNLYGTTSYGGSDSSCDGGCGTAFELTPGSGGAWTETILYNFAVSVSQPNGLIFDEKGRLYGTTAGGGRGYGTVFRLSPGRKGKWNLDVLCEFSYYSDGGYPRAGLSIDSAGVLWGATDVGGADSDGVVFKLKRDGSDFKVVVDFDYNNGQGPGPLTMRKGRVYGTTESGGSCSNGTVFSLTPSGKHSFTLDTIDYFPPCNGGDNGISPLGGVTFSKNGQLYGTTSDGGGDQQGCDQGGCGTVYKLIPRKDSWKEIVLYRFQGGDDGAYPYSGVVIDTSGNLFGTTSQGGAYGNGTVYEINP